MPGGRRTYKQEHVRSEGKTVIAQEGDGARSVRYELENVQEERLAHITKIRGALAGSIRNCRQRGKRQAKRWCKRKTIPGRRTASDFVRPHFIYYSIFELNLF